MKPVFYKVLTETVDLHELNIIDVITTIKRCITLLQTIRGSEMI